MYIWNWNMEKTCSNCKHCSYCKKRWDEGIVVSTIKLIHNIEKVFPSFDPVTVFLIQDIMLNKALARICEDYENSSEEEVVIDG